MLDLESELNLPEDQFERKLTERLREEIRANREKVDADFKRELMLEKRRILSQAVSFCIVCDRWSLE